MRNGLSVLLDVNSNEKLSVGVDLNLLPRWE
jgi:hypothetical protein